MRACQASRHEIEVVPVDEDVIEVPVHGVGEPEG